MLARGVLDLGELPDEKGQRALSSTGARDGGEEETLPEILITRPFLVFLRRRRYAIDGPSELLEQLEYSIEVFARLLLKSGEQSKDYGSQCRA